MGMVCGASNIRALNAIKDLNGSENALVMRWREDIEHLCRGLP